MYRAVLDRAAGRIEEALSRAEGAADTIVNNMGEAFQAMMATHRDEILMVMQAHAIAEPPIREHMREIYRRIHRTVAARFEEAAIADAHEEAARFIATGQFIVVIEVLGIPEMYGFKEK